jgi:hypothetical protein
MATKGNGKHYPHRLWGERGTGGPCKRGGLGDAPRGKVPAGNRQGDLLCKRNNQRGRGR